MALSALVLAVAFGVAAVVVPGGTAVAVSCEGEPLQRSDPPD